VKAKWVTWRNDAKAEREYYEMDNVGKLVKGPGNVPIHHSRPLEPMTSVAPTVSETAYWGAKFDQELEPVTIEFGTTGEVEGLWDFWSMD
jgi:hypothetical protein